MLSIMLVMALMLKLMMLRSISNENVQTGWSFKAMPLFDVRHTVLQYIDTALLQEATQQWFIHVVYSETQNNIMTIKQYMYVRHGDGRDNEDVKMLQLALVRLKQNGDDLVEDVYWAHHPSDILLHNNIKIINNSYVLCY